MDKATYQEEYGKYGYMREQVKEDFNRLAFHLMPPTGWMNDPNGLCQLKGLYHLYFQFSPFKAGWDTKLWGHYTTRDWIHFREEEPFLFPDCPWDRDGVYSGSAFVKDGEIHYFYTGNVKLWGKPYDYIMEGREQNTIHFVSRDGFTAGPKELLMTNEDYSANMSKHVRDPKLYEKNGTYYMVQGARDSQSRGCVLLFESQDLIHWSFCREIRSREPFGYMWECPDLFELDGQELLLVCPQGVKRQGHDYQNIYQCGYFPIDFKPEGEISLGEFRELDKGFDIYAPQSFQDEKGRRILIGWMGIPDAEYPEHPTAEHGWIHALTMPRELSWRDGRLYQAPLKEMEELRGEKRQTTVAGWEEWETEDCCFELSVQLDREPEKLRLRLREDAILSYEEGILTLALGKSGYGRTKRTAKLDGLKNFTVFSDTSALEIFINDGSCVMTSRVYSEGLRQKVLFEACDVLGEAVCYRLKGYQVEWRK